MRKDRGKKKKQEIKIEFKIKKMDILALMKIFQPQKHI